MRQEDQMLLDGIRAQAASAVRAALDAGADANVRDHCNLDASVLVTAIEAGSAELVALLLAAGADPDDGGANSWTPLVTAVEHGDPAIVEQLLAAGAVAGTRDEPDGPVVPLTTLFDAHGKVAAVNPLSAHRHSRGHRADLAQSERAGCFHCLAVFAPSDIVDWCGRGTRESAVCPYCGIDSVVPSNRVPLTPVLLEEMSRVWF